MHDYPGNTLYGVFSQVVRFHFRRAYMLLEKVGVYPGQPKLFFILENHEGYSQKELAEKIYVKAATMTIMLNRLEAANLIERRPDLNDQRVLRIYLTEQGKKVHSEVKEVLKEIESECFHNFTEEERLLLHKLFLQMRENLMMACGENPNEQSAQHMNRP